MTGASSSITAEEAAAANVASLRFLGARSHPSKGGGGRAGEVLPSQALVRLAEESKTHNKLSASLFGFRPFSTSGKKKAAKETSALRTASPLSVRRSPLEG